jgi:hypothetical protein
MVEIMARGESRLEETRRDESFRSCAYPRISDAGGLDRQKSEVGKCHACRWHARCYQSPGNLNGNVCWTIKERHTYPQGSGVIIRDETWKPGPDVTIRESRPGRGYWKGDVWTDF